MSASDDDTQIPSNWETTGRGPLHASLFIHTFEVSATGHSSNGIWFWCLSQGTSAVLWFLESCSLSRSNTPGSAVLTMCYRTYFSSL